MVLAAAQLDQTFLPGGRAIGQTVDTTIQRESVIRLPSLMEGTCDTEQLHMLNWEWGWEGTEEQFVPNCPCNCVLEARGLEITLS